MHDRDARLVEILENCNFDRARLSDADAAELFNLARAARIELPQLGAIWPSSPDVGERAGEITIAEPRP